MEVHHKGQVKVQGGWEMPGPLTGQTQGQLCFLLTLYSLKMITYNLQ